MTKHQQPRHPGFDGGPLRVTNEFASTPEFRQRDGARLVNDNEAPGANKTYGTDSTGKKVWKNDPSGGAGASATTVEVDLGAANFTGTFTITAAEIVSTSKILAWQAPGPYTGKGSRADEAEMQPVQIVSVVPGTGSALVRWQTPPIFVTRNIVGTSGGVTKVATSTQVGIAQLPQVVERRGLVKGNVKFSYVVFN